MQRYHTKPGRHGTLYLYALSYADDGGEFRDTVRYWGYDAEDALLRFLDAEDADGWPVLSYARVQVERPASSWERHTF